MPAQHSHLIRNYKPAVGFTKHPARLKSIAKNSKRCQCKTKILASLSFLDKQEVFC